jgi:hypothetical protein
MKSGWKFVADLEKKSRVPEIFSVGEVSPEKRHIRTLCQDFASLV